MSMGLHFYERLFRKLSPNEEDPGYIQASKLAATKKLIEHFSRTTPNTTFSCATAMDPRQKFSIWTKQVSYEYMISENINAVKHEWETIYKKPAENPEENDIDDDFGFNNSSLRVPDDELLHYITSSVLISNETSPSQALTFWKQHEKELPNLSKMAKFYLTIPITSTSAERLFSSARHLITYNRSSLLPDTIKEYVLLKDWFKNFKST